MGTANQLYDITSATAHKKANFPQIVTTFLWLPAPWTVWAHKTMDDAEVRAWVKDLNKLEDILRDAVASRCRATESFPHKLKLAFKAVDFDERGFGVETGCVSYSEFVRALERFGFYATGREAIALRGLFDRYNPDFAPDVNYAAFISGLYADEKPWPPPPKRDPAECKTEAKEQLRESPANRWANSSDELVPHERPQRVLSLANEAHRTQIAPTWTGSPEKTTVNWSRVRDALPGKRGPPIP